ncbi:MAG: M48 family metallopeptidase, partial [Bradyrhizobiaceae bacterium]|nr:M48 family metallopeptidase [Bradyrhizobiaceae bacterium]
MRLRPLVRGAIAATTAFAVGVGQLAVAVPARAEADKGLPLIRDAEIEQLLRDYTRPILHAAGLGQRNIRVVIVNDRSFNAFVIDAKRIFVNTGALMDAETPNQIIGVLAHETGHIAGGHLSKLHSELANAQTAMILAMLLGVGAVAAAATSHGNAGDPSAAILGPQLMVMRSLLAYQRAQEEQADRAGVHFLTMTGQSPKGMYDTFKRFADQQLFAAHNADPYLQSHPMAADRIAALEGIARPSPYWNKKDPPELQLRHDLMRAKLFGYLEAPDTLMRRYPLSNTSLAARYGRAVSAFRHSDVRGAIAQIDGLIQSQPGNPYFLELKGQALVESGRAREALAPLRHAISLAPDPTLIEVLLGQALLGANDPALVDEAIASLRKALTADSEIPDAYDNLAIAYGRKGEFAEADLASAQAAFNRGSLPTARQLAARAKGRF